MTGKKDQNIATAGTVAARVGPSTYFRVADRAGVRRAAFRPSRAQRCPDSSRPAGPAGPAPCPRRHPVRRPRRAAGQPAPAAGPKPRRESRRCARKGDGRRLRAAGSPPDARTQRACEAEEVLSPASRVVTKLGSPGLARTRRRATPTPRAASRAARPPPSRSKAGAAWRSPESAAREEGRGWRGWRLERQVPALFTPARYCQPLDMLAPTPGRPPAPALASWARTPAQPSAPLWNAWTHQRAPRCGAAALAGAAGGLMGGKNLGEPGRPSTCRGVA